MRCGYRWFSFQHDIQCVGGELQRLSASRGGQRDLSDRYAGGVQNVGLGDFRICQGERHVAVDDHPRLAAEAQHFFALATVIGVFLFSWIPVSAQS